MKSMRLLVSTVARGLACLVLALVVTATAAAADLHVPEDYESIKAALGAAMEGDIVRVAPGHYEEDGLVIPSGVELEGAGALFTEIWAGDDTPSIIFQGDGRLFGVWVHGGQPALQMNGNNVDVVVDSCWIGPAQRAVDAVFQGESQLLLQRCVIWADNDGVVVQYDALGRLRVHNNHFLGMGSGWYISLQIEGAGTEDSITVIHNNIFENGALGLTLPLAGITGQHTALVMNNVFIGNHLGMEISCGNLLANQLMIGAFNNWYVEDETGVDVIACTALGASDLHHNAYFGNADDVLGGAPALTSLVGEPPMFEHAAPNDQHEDDYRLQAGSAGIDSGFGIETGPNQYMDPDDSVPDIGAYGGTFAGEWNWDGDPVSESDGDCDDRDADRFPGNIEICDGADNDCDGVVQDDLDEDGDGFSICDGDCDDHEPTVHPDMDEDCSDGLDNDCDGMIDDADDECGAGDDAGDDAGLDDDDNPAGFRCECQLGRTPVSTSAWVLGLGALGLALRRLC